MEVLFLFVLYRKVLGAPECLVAYLSRRGSVEADISSLEGGTLLSLGEVAFSGGMFFPR